MWDLFLRWGSEGVVYIGASLDLEDRKLKVWLRNRVFQLWLVSGHICWPVLHIKIPLTYKRVSHLLGFRIVELDSQSCMISVCYEFSNRIPRYCLVTLTSSHFPVVRKERMTWPLLTQRVVNFINLGSYYEIIYTLTEISTPHQKHILLLLLFKLRI